MTRPEGIAWGTEPLISREKFEGKIVKGQWGTGKEEYGSKARFVFEIEPTSYDGRGKNRFAAFNWSEQSRSPWGFLQKQLESMNIPVDDDGFNEEEDLVGYVFEWETQTLFTMTDRNTQEERNVTALLPIRLVSRPGKAASKGKKTASVESQGSVEDFILSEIRASQKSLEELYAEGKEKGFGKSKVFTAIKELENRGKILEDEGVVAVVEK